MEYFLFLFFWSGSLVFCFTFCFLLSGFLLACGLAGCAYWLSLWHFLFLAQFLVGRFDFLEFSLQSCDLLVLHLYLVAFILDSCEQRVELIVVDLWGIETVDTVDEVAEDIHVVGEGVKGAGVDAAVESYTAGFCGHEAEVVAGLQIVPILVDTWVVGDTHTLRHAVELVESFALHGVAEP